MTDSEDTRDTTDFESVETDEEAESDDLSAEEEAAQLAAVFSELRARCEEFSIECHEERDFDDEPMFRIDVPAGRRTRSVFIWTAEKGRALLEERFEQFRYLGDYEAICSYEGGTIEAALRNIGSATPRRIAKAFGLPDENVTRSELPDIGVRGDGPYADLSVSLTSPSVLLRRLSRPGPRRFALRIEGLHLRGHDAYVQALETVANSWFFETDAKYALAFALERRRVPPRRRRFQRGAAPVGFPRSAYDSEPMSLYWYARGAAGMPLLQFLAFYQAIEFYFPAYSQADARQKLQNIVKDPEFNPHSDRHIGRLVDVLVARGRSPFGDERAQLRATVRATVDVHEIRDLVDEQGNAEFFAKKISGLTEVTLKSTLSDVDLMDHVADRLYDIRCRIVHTKETSDGDEFGLLLPFSRQADQLGHDIELVRIVCRRVLVANSRPFSLHN
jgi:hypothetical protein